MKFRHPDAAERSRLRKCLNAALHRVANSEYLNQVRAAEVDGITQDLMAERAENEELRAKAEGADSLRRELKNLRADRELLNSAFMEAKRRLVKSEAELTRVHSEAKVMDGKIGSSVAVMRGRVPSIDPVGEVLAILEGKPSNVVSIEDARKSMEAERRSNNACVIDAETVRVVRESLSPSRKHGVSVGDLVEVTEGAPPAFREGPYRARVAEIFNDHECAVEPLEPDPKHARYTLAQADRLVKIPEHICSFCGKPLSEKEVKDGRTLHVSPCSSAPARPMKGRVSP